MLTLFVMLAFIGLRNILLPGAHPHPGHDIIPGLYLFISTILLIILLFRLRRQKLIISNTAILLTSDRILIHQAYPRLNQQSIDYKAATSWQRLQNPIQIPFGLCSLIPNFNKKADATTTSQSQLSKDLNQMSSMMVYNAESIPLLSMQQAEVLKIDIANAIQNSVNHKQTESRCSTTAPQPKSAQSDNKNTHSTNTDTPAQPAQPAQFTREKRYALIFALKYKWLIVIGALFSLTGLASIHQLKPLYTSGNLGHAVLMYFAITIIATTLYCLYKASKDVISIQEHSIQFSAPSVFAFDDHIPFEQIISSNLQQSILERALGLYSVEITIKRPAQSHPHSTRVKFEWVTIPLLISGLSKPHAQAICNHAKK